MTRRPWYVSLLAFALSLFAACPANAQLPEIEEATSNELLSNIRAGDAELTLVNFWATWCTPCREEIPALVRIGRAFASEGLRLIFVSGDFAEDVPDARRFLAEHGVTTPSFMSSGMNQGFIQAIYPDWSGALPATAVYGPGGSQVDFWEGARTFEEIDERLRSILDRNKSAE